MPNTFDRHRAEQILVEVAWRHSVQARMALAVPFERREHAAARTGLLDTRNTTTGLCNCFIGEEQRRR